MTSRRHGRSTSVAEVTNVSLQGFWILVEQREYFVPFKEFPWFRDATIGELTKVGLPSSHHLHWPHLDVDLAVESLEHPERYPLVSRARPNRRLEPAKAQQPPQRRSGRQAHLRD